jgi:hypothetical protein
MDDDTKGLPGDEGVLPRLMRGGINGACMYPPLDVTGIPAAVAPWPATGVFMRNGSLMAGGGDPKEKLVGHAVVTDGEAPRDVGR